MSGCLGLGEGREWGMTDNGYRVWGIMKMFWN